MDAVGRSKVRGARDMLRECAKQLRSIDATGHAMLADMHANELGDFCGTDAQATTEPAKHTPGDWYVKPSPERDGLDAVRDEERSFDPGEHETHVMCHLALEAYPNTRDLEFHAQRIVLAVNCHDDLLDMLKAVEARISIEQQEHMDDPAPGTYCCGAIHIELLALIAKAEGI